MINRPTAGLTPIVSDATQISVSIDNVPGATAQIAEALQEADVNIEGICHTQITDRNVTEKLIVDRADAARAAIAALRKPFSVEEVIRVQLSQDRPGFIAAVARALGNAGINIENIYHASTGRNGFAILYISVANENFEKAKQLAQTL